MVNTVISDRIHEKLVNLEAADNSIVVLKGIPPLGGRSYGWKNRFIKNR